MEYSIRNRFPENAEAAFGDMDAQNRACEQGREVLGYTIPFLGEHRSDTQCSKSDVYNNL
jgi:hypothetical protein